MCRKLVLGLLLVFSVAFLVLEALSQADQSYDAEKAIKYANKYCAEPNTKDYDFLERDCANFVSQCLIDGGKMDDSNIIKDMLKNYPYADGKGRTITRCTCLHDFLVNYLGAQYKTLKGADLLNGESEPDWFKPGDIAIVHTVEDPSRYTGLGKHAVFAVRRTKVKVTIGGTQQEVDRMSFSGHTPQWCGDQKDYTVENLLKKNFDYCTYYHIPRSKEDPHRLPPRPSGLKAEAVSRDKIILTWKDNSDNEDGFEIYRDRSFLTKVAARAGMGETVSFLDTGLSKKTEYCYQVRAFNTVGQSGLLPPEYSCTGKQLTKICAKTPSNVPPKVYAGEDRIVPLLLPWLPYYVVTLSGQASDPDDDPMTFWWEVVKKPDGSTAQLSNNTTLTPTLIANMPGVYTIKFSAKDTGKAVASDQVQITFTRAVARVLLAGTSNPGRVYSYQGGSNWQPISGELGFAVLSLIEYSGVLYAGTMSTSSLGAAVGRLYRYEGGQNWTIVCDNLDNQISSLAVYKGSLYIGTAWQGGRLYRFDGPDNCKRVVDHAPWSGFRSAYVWGGYLYLGDIAWDKIGRFDGKSFQPIVHLGGSCIYDFAAYNDELYAGAYIGRLHKSPNGTDWSLALPPTVHGHLWELEVFKGSLYMGFNSGALQRFSGKSPESIWTAPDSIISMVALGDYLLYLGTGGEAGYSGRISGDGRVYVYDGTATPPTPISEVLGTGVQVLYIYIVPKGTGATTAPTIETLKTTARHRAADLIEFIIEQQVKGLQLQIFNLAGELVLDTDWIEGNRFEWALQDKQGRRLANGVYLYLISARGYDGETLKSQVKKLVILR